MGSSSQTETVGSLWAAVASTSKIAPTDGQGAVSATLGLNHTLDAKSVIIDRIVSLSLGAAGMLLTFYDEDGANEVYTVGLIGSGVALNRPGCQSWELGIEINSGWSIQAGQTDGILVLYRIVSRKES